MKYRICWKSKETENSGKGEPVFNSREMAQKIADDLDKDASYLHHWVEGVSEGDEDD